MDEVTAWGKARQVPSRLRAICAEALEKGKLWMWTCEGAERKQCGLSSGPVKEDQDEVGRWAGHARLSTVGGFLLNHRRVLCKRLTCSDLLLCEECTGWVADRNKSKKTIRLLWQPRPKIMVVWTKLWPH